MCLPPYEWAWQGIQKEDAGKDLKARGHPTSHASTGHKMDLRAVHVAVERMMADQDDKADNERSAVDDGENMIHPSRGTPGYMGRHDAH